MPTKEINCASLAIVLRKDTAVATFGRAELAPGYRRFGNNLTPAELVCSADVQENTKAYFRNP